MQYVYLHAFDVYFILYMLILNAGNSIVCPSLINSAHIHYFNLAMISVLHCLYTPRITSFRFPFLENTIFVEKNLNQSKSLYC